MKLDKILKKHFSNEVQAIVLPELNSINIIQETQSYSDNYVFRFASVFCYGTIIILFLTLSSLSFNNDSLAVDTISNASIQKEYYEKYVDSIIRFAKYLQKSNTFQKGE